MRWDASTPSRLLGLVLFVAMALAAWMATAPWWAPESAAAAASQLGFSTLCHQLPARSFRLDGHAMSLCHRCAGIYAGVGLGGAFAALGLRVDPKRRAVWLGVAAMMLAQVGAGWATDALDRWPLRVATGLLLGGWGGLALASVLGRSDQSSNASTSRRSRDTTAGVAP